MKIRVIVSIHSQGDFRLVPLLLADSPFPSGSELSFE
jgi:hypothetical protein